MAGAGDRSRKGDIALAPPTVKSPETVPAVEDRTYLAFMVSALVIAVGLGFAFAIVIPLAAVDTIPGASRVPWLTQAHGWAQLQGWAGLFVAGMGIRIIPRFAGRRPIGRSITLPLVTALAGSVIIRSVVQPWARGSWGDEVLVAAGAMGGLGMLGVAAVLAVTLARTRRRGNPWELFAWEGTAWWAVWAIFTAVAPIRAADNFGLTPGVLDDAMTWMVLLGAVGNFVWGVQSRSVPVFFGRKPPKARVIIAPLVLYNSGIVLVMLSLAEWSPATSARLEGAGLALAGLASLVLAPLCGSIWGQAHRLRPRARSASRFVIAGNIAGMTGGVLLLVAGIHTFAEGSIVSFHLRDAARHAFGVGLVTMLILGMAQLIAPVFAMSRAEDRGPSLPERLPFWLLIGAVVLRVGAGIVRETSDMDLLHHTIALAGTMAWLALLLFAIAVAQAIRREPQMKALLAG
ncbi:MAG: hypothetical protein KC479_01685 [Dehalococcoidia bacterium]|nr:hypothetical protein [Dehalococcoidia bacterium]